MLRDTKIRRWTFSLGGFVSTMSTGMLPIKERAKTRWPGYFLRNVIRFRMAFTFQNRYEVHENERVVFSANKVGIRKIKYTQKSQANVVGSSSSERLR